MSRGSKMSPGSGGIRRGDILLPRPRRDSPERHADDPAQYEFAGEAFCLPGPGTHSSGPGILYGEIEYDKNQNLRADTAAGHRVCE